MNPKRIELTPASGIDSIYVRNGKNLDISNFNNVGQKGNYITPGMFEALKKLDALIRVNNGTFQITDLFRSWEVQAENRKKYETGTKTAFVASPGSSFHQAGSAIDVAVKKLNFKNVSREKWLQLFWDLAEPLDFVPIIPRPDDSISECWHFDHISNDWKDAYGKLNYSEAAKCAILDVGEWNPNESREKIQKMYLQSQLIRLGFYKIGKVDGVIGNKTSNALLYLGLTGTLDETIQELTQR